MIDQFQSEVGYLRDQNSSYLENLMGHNIQNSTNFFEQSEPMFFPKFINRDTNHLIFSDSIYKKYGNLTFFMILGLILIPLQQLLIWDKESNSIRQEQNANHSFFVPIIIALIKSVLREAAASQLCEIVTKAIKKLKLHPLWA